MIYSLCFCNSVFVCLFSARYALAGRFFCSLVGLFFFFFSSFPSLCCLLFYSPLSLSLSRNRRSRLVRSRCAANDSRSLSCSWLSYACSPSFPLLLALSGSLSLNSSHVFVVAATVVIAHTIALSGLGPGANFIQQFNSIIGSGYGYLFYTFLLIISVILAGNMASVFCHMFALYFLLFFSKFPFMLPFIFVCLCLCLYEIATSTLIFSVANQFADRPGTS